MKTNHDTPFTLLENSHQLLTILNTLKKPTLYFGPQGFIVVSTMDELVLAQQGFSTHPDNTPLVSSEAGHWKINWLVIARDTELGDPYFIDINQENSPVYTAMLHNNQWQTEQVSSSLINFIQCLHVLAQSSDQQSPQFIADENTITDPIVLTTLKNKLFQFSHCENFWQMFFESYLDWLEDDED